jgi:predicted O-methyltransferase YrrM
MMPTEDIAEQDFSAWYAGKNFTSDWSSRNFSLWSRILAGLLTKQPEILEIGCYEGRSVIFWLEYFRNSQVTCIDSYEGWTKELRPKERRLAEARFDANVAEYGSRVVKMKMRSVSGLELFASKGAHFDLIYIDGDHSRAAVLVDSFLSWPLLRPGGVLIWDDYALRLTTKPPEERPQQAIDLFLSWYENELRILHKDFQVIVEKAG